MKTAGVAGRRLRALTAKSTDEVTLYELNWHIPALMSYSHESSVQDQQEMRPSYSTEQAIR